MLYRKIKDWRWYKDPNTFRLFIHLLLEASRKQFDFEIHKLLPGQVITGRKVLAMDLGLSEQQIRTSINKLKSTSEITIKSTNKFSIITICKWDEYQHIETPEQPAKQPVIEQSDNQQVTTYKNKRKKEVYKRTTVSFNPPSLNEVIDFFKSKGLDEQIAKKAFDHYDIADWKNTNGKPVGSWKQTMLTNWINSSRSYTPNGKQILTEPQPFKPLGR